MGRGREEGFVAWVGVGDPGEERVVVKTGQVEDGGHWVSNDELKWLGMVTTTRLTGFRGELCVFEAAWEEPGEAPQRALDGGYGGDIINQEGFVAGEC